MVPRFTFFSVNVKMALRRGIPGKRLHIAKFFWNTKPCFPGKPDLPGMGVHSACAQPGRNPGFQVAHCARAVHNPEVTSVVIFAQRSIREDPLMTLTEVLLNVIKEEERLGRKKVESKHWSICTFTNQGKREDWSHFHHNTGQWDGVTQKPLISWPLAETRVCLLSNWLSKPLFFLQDKDWVKWGIELSVAVVVLSTVFDSGKKLCLLEEACTEIKGEQWLHITADFS